MFKNLVLASVCLAGWSAFAKDYSLGYVLANGQETPVVSVRIEGDTATLRYVTPYNAAKCGRYRKELCNVVGKVKMAESVIPASACTVVSETLLNCAIDPFKEKGTKAIVNDGSEIPLKDVQGHVQFGELKTLVYVDEKTGFQPRTGAYLDVEIWGHRADGLDALIQGGHNQSLFSRGTYDVVTKSLFDN